MSKQHNKAIKRRRRTDYIKRKKTAANSKKTAAKSGAA